MYFGEGVISHELDVGHQWYVDALCNVDGLEEFVVALLFIEVVVDGILVEHVFLDEHEGLNVFEIDIFFEGAGKEEEVLEYTGTLGIILLHGVVGLFDVVRELLITRFGYFEDVLVSEHIELLSHVLECHVHLEEVSFAADQDSLELVNQVLSLLKDRAQHLQG